MTLGYVYFFVLALLAVVGAIATVASPNPIRSALGLLLSIVSIAGLYLALHAQFLAAIQLIVYAGAVVVLFIFVIMLLGPSSASPPESKGGYGRLAGAGLFSLVGIGGIALVAQAIGNKAPLPPVVENDFGSIEAFGHSLFTDGVVPFELSSALLIVAVVGALAVARGKQGGDLLSDGKLVANAKTKAQVGGAALAAKASGAVPARVVAAKEGGEA
jgi:NADH-quinone oxidoreductase subunit J